MSGPSPQHFLQKQNFALRRDNADLRQANDDLRRELMAHRALLAKVKLNWWQRWKLKRFVARAKAEAAK